MNFKCSLDLTDDDVARTIFKHYVGHTFPVMLTYYVNGKYRFEGYDTDHAVYDITPKEEEDTKEITYAV